MLVMSGSGVDGHAAHPPLLERQCARTLGAKTSNRPGGRISLSARERSDPRAFFMSADCSCIFFYSAPACDAP